MRSTGRRNTSGSRRVRRPVSVAMRGWYGALAGADDLEAEPALARAGAGAVRRDHPGAVAARLECAALEAAAERHALRAGALAGAQNADPQPARARLALDVAVRRPGAAPPASPGAGPCAAAAGAALDGDRHGPRLGEQVAEHRPALDPPASSRA